MPSPAENKTINQRLSYSEVILSRYSNQRGQKDHQQYSMEKLFLLPEKMEPGKYSLVQMNRPEMTLSLSDLWVPMFSHPKSAIVYLWRQTLTPDTPPIYQCGVSLVFNA